jgi:MULE transposase domain
MMNSDATYRILRKKCPIFPVGFSDKNRVFYPVLINIASNETAEDFEFFFNAWKNNYGGEGELQMKFIMSDGAAAMRNGAKLISLGRYPYVWADILRTMCFAHVHLVR